MYLCRKDNKKLSIMQEKCRKSEVQLLKFVKNPKYRYHFFGQGTVPSAGSCPVPSPRRLPQGQRPHRPASHRFHLAAPLLEPLHFAPPLHPPRLLQVKGHTVVRGGTWATDLMAGCFVLLQMLSCLAPDAGVASAWLPRVPYHCHQPHRRLKS